MKDSKIKENTSTTATTLPCVGGVVFAAGDIEYNVGKRPRALTVRNTGDRPIQVGSHFHFFEVNRYLCFARHEAYGCHLNIPATTAVRFEAGEQKSVEVVPFGGKSRIIGFGGLVEGFAGAEGAPTYYPTYLKALSRMHKRGYKTTNEQEQ